MLERTRELGLLRAVVLGAAKVDILRALVAEACAADNASALTTPSQALY